MRQIWITMAGPPEVLQVKEAPDPEPKAGEVRIRVEASGINFADILGRLGLYPDLPPIVGYARTGTIRSMKRSSSWRVLSERSGAWVRRDRHRASTSLPTESSACSPRGMGLFGLAPRKVSPVGRTAS